MPSKLRVIGSNPIQVTQRLPQNLSNLFLLDGFRHLFTINLYRVMSCCCYILYSVKLNKFYVGSTTDMERRLADHNRGKERYTKTGCPWELVYSENFEVLRDARDRERYIKKQKSRKYIELLIGNKKDRHPDF